MKDNVGVTRKLWTVTESTVSEASPTRVIWLSWGDILVDVTTIGFMKYKKFFILWILKLMSPYGKQVSQDKVTTAPASDDPTTSV